MKTSLLIAGSLALVPMTYAQDKPNIIIILADDLGFSDLGCAKGNFEVDVIWENHQLKEAVVRSNAGGDCV